MLEIAKFTNYQIILVLIIKKRDKDLRIEGEYERKQEP